MEVVAAGFGVEVEPDVFHVLVDELPVSCGLIVIALHLFVFLLGKALDYFKHLDETSHELLFVWLVLLDEIDHQDLPVAFQEFAEVALEDMLRHPVRPQYLDLRDKAFLSLLPKEWYAATNLHKTENVHFC